MNVKLIFLFTICVVLPNGLHSEDLSEHVPTKREKEEMCRTFLQQWKPCKNGTFERIDDETIFIRILVQPGAHKLALFLVPNMDRLGVNVTSKTPNEIQCNLEVMDFFGFLLGVRFLDVSIEEGCTSEYKTLKFSDEYLHMVEVRKAIFDKYVEMKYGS